MSNETTFAWQYPVFLLPHEMGYASIVDPSQEDSPTHMLIVHTDEEAAQRQMFEFTMLGAPRAINNAREFRWLLQSLHAPVTEVVFDPQPVEKEVNEKWRINVQELINKHIVADNSPWNYPAFIVAQESGFACITGGAANNPMVAIGVFTSRENANAYLEACNESGELCELKNLDEAVAFFSGLISLVDAAAVDPTAEEVDGEVTRTAQYCFGLETLLNKYLKIEDKAADDATV